MTLQILQNTAKWLLSIPRDEIPFLLQTPECTAFMEAFQNLERAHLKCIARRRNYENERFCSCQEEEEDDDDQDDDQNDDQNDDDLRTTSGSSISISRTSVVSANGMTMDNGISLKEQQDKRQLENSKARGGGRCVGLSFLQHKALDDIILRIFEFLPCQTLIHIGQSCHRFHLLTRQSARQRITIAHSYHDSSTRRSKGSTCDTTIKSSNYHYYYYNHHHLNLLESSIGSPGACEPGSEMKLLRAKEQIEGIRPDIKPFVRIPLLGLPRRIYVSGCGDEEYNGIYFCTGNNGNGFLFSKPRSNSSGINSRVRWSRRSRRVQHEHDVNDMEIEQFGDGNIVHPAVAAAGENDINNNINNYQNNDDDVVIVNGRGLDEEEEEEEIHPFLQTDRNLRCIIGKRFSNEDLIWYMYKEILDDETGNIKHVFSFWAKLMVAGTASYDVCRYPSQTSILSMNGNPAWQPLANTLTIIPPIVELMD